MRAYMRVCMCAVVNRDTAQCLFSQNTGGGTHTGSVVKVTYASQADVSGHTRQHGGPPGPRGQ